MKQPEKLTAWDFWDNHQEPDGYDMKTVPDATSRNFNKLLDEHNNLVEVVNTLIKLAPRDFFNFDDGDK